MAALASVLSQLSSADDDERMVGLLMLTKILPPPGAANAADPEQVQLRAKLFGALGDAFLKRLLATREDGDEHRALALCIISAFVVDAPAARKFRSAVPVFLRAMRTATDVSVVQDAVACFGGVLASGANIAAANYAKMAVSLCAAAGRVAGDARFSVLASSPKPRAAPAVPIPADGDSDDEEKEEVKEEKAAARVEPPPEVAQLALVCVGALGLLAPVLRAWEASSSEPLVVLNSECEERVVALLAPLVTHPSPDVALAAAGALCDLIASPAALPSLILSSSPSPTGHTLRQAVKALLSVYGSQGHVDAGLRLAALMAHHLPLPFTAEPQFVLLSVRQAGIELKLMLDELESDVAGVLCLEDRRASAVVAERDSSVFASAASLFESAVRYLIAHDVMEEDVAVSPSPPPGPVAAPDPAALAALFHAPDAAPPADPGAFEADRQKDAAAKKAAGEESVKKLQTCHARWVDFPGDVLLMLRGFLEDIVRVCVSFLAALGSAEVVASVLTGAAPTPEGPVGPLCALVHPYACGAVRMVGKYLAEDSESFQEELLDVLPLCVALAPGSSPSPSTPLCVQRPLCFLLPALMLRTVETDFLTRFLDARCGDVLVAWLLHCCRAFMVMAMERRRVQRAGGGAAEGGSEDTNNLIPLLSMASAVLMNVTSLTPSSQLGELVREGAWLELVRSTVAVSEKVLGTAAGVGAPGLECYGGEERQELVGVLLSWACVALQVVRAFGSVPAFVAACSAKGVTLAPAALARCQCALAALYVSPPGQLDEGEEEGDLDAGHMLAHLTRSMQRGFPQLFDPARV